MKSLWKYIILALAMSCLTACAPESEVPQFKMTAKVEGVGTELSVTVIEAPHGNSGPFWVLVSSDTPVTDAEGRAADYTSINVGDTIEITYGGQVMMSYPPKISAQSIRVISTAKDQ